MDQKWSNSWSVRCTRRQNSSSFRMRSWLILWQELTDQKFVNRTLWAIAESSASEIDAANILQANCDSKTGMKSLMKRLMKTFKKTKKTKKENKAVPKQHQNKALDVSKCCSNHCGDFCQLKGCRLQIIPFLSTLVTSWGLETGCFCAKLWCFGRLWVCHKFEWSSLGSRC